MTLCKQPMVFRLAGMLLLAATVLGQWWQRQPLGADGRAIVAIVQSYCPSIDGEIRHLTVADSARLLDRWSYAFLGDLIGWNDQRRCASSRPSGAGRQGRDGEEGQAKPLSEMKKRAGLIRTSGFGDHIS